MSSNTTLKHRKSTTIDRREREPFSLKADDELQSWNLRNNRCQRETDSEQTFTCILTEQNLLQTYRIRKLEADSEKDAANFKVQLQEYQSQLDSLKCEKLKLLERNEILTEQNKRQAKFLVQVACVLSHPASIVCILAIIVGVFLHCNNILNMASDCHLLRERNADLTDQNNRQSLRIKKLEADCDHFDIQIGEQKVKFDAMNSEYLLLLRQQIAFAGKQNGAFTEQNNRQSSRIEKLETESKEQREHFDKQLQTAYELTGKLVVVVNSQNDFLRENSAIANKQIESLQSRNEKMSDESKEKYHKAIVLRMNEDQESWNFLVRCMQEKDNESKGVSKVSILWGAVEVTYATQSGLDECLIMHEATYRRQASYLQIQ